MKLAIPAAIFLSCASSATRGESRPSPLSADGPQNPLGVTIEQQVLADGEAQLLVTFRRAPINGEVRLEADAPPGVRVSGLEQTAMLSSSGQVGQWQVPVTLRWSSGVPSADFVVRLSVSTPELKATARGTYRFGRPEPELPRTVFTPTTARLGHIALEGTVVMDPPPPSAAGTGAAPKGD